MSYGLALLTLTVSARLIANTVSLSIGGTVDTSPYSSVPVGSRFGGTISYDPAAAPFTTDLPVCMPACSGQLASYFLPQQFTLQFDGGSVLSSNSGWPNAAPGEGNGSVTVYDNFCCTFVFISDAIEFDGVMVAAGPLAVESAGVRCFCDSLTRRICLMARVCLIHSLR
jgi:hypothetical protein